MTPKLLGKIKELVAAGTVVAGSRPAKSPSLSDYPGCDEEVQRLTRELWGAGEPPAEITERTYGKGRLFWGGAAKEGRTTVEFASCYRCGQVDLVSGRQSGRRGPAGATLFSPPG